ncbi:hypothetical protein MLD38_006451 [Melastoma candidum]|uniref:Uncharacterized protein n=1 Tax=Melastoma candidum TaxID=119954 RepID=A0ACB9RM71_9MYRT|nr:hypothetical protein MLD38_006451 [Melastoma candidum]
MRMASSASSALSSLLPSLSTPPPGLTCCHRSCAINRTRLRSRDQGFLVYCSDSGYDVSGPEEIRGEIRMVNRRSAIGFACGLPASLFFYSVGANAAGLPPEEKPKLCDSACEKELENVPMVTTESGLQYKDIVIGEGPSPPIGFQVAANYVAMVPSGQVFDSSLEKGQIYIFRVGAGQVIKGLDEGILSMKVGGKRRLYIPGSLAFPKGLTSAPGRPRVAPSSPVVFDVSLEYIPGLDDE